jgi:hypothetical protein
VAATRRSSWSGRGRSTRVVNDTLLDHYTTLYAIEQMWHPFCLENTCDLGNGNDFMDFFDNK